jgi:hypothetical protein
MLKFWKEVGKETPIRQEVGKLIGNDSDNTIVCSGTPSQIRKFSPSTAWGELLTETTDYTYNSETMTITLVVTPATGETVVASSSGEHIFNSQYAIVNSSNTADRTLEQQVFIEVEEALAKSVTVSVADYLASYGLSTNIVYLAPDNSGSPGSYGAAGAALSMGDLDNGSVTPFWVKEIIPLGDTKEKYHDIYFVANTVEHSPHL